jgi:hypothetical protein
LHKQYNTREIKLIKASPAKTPPPSPRLIFVALHLPSRRKKDSSSHMIERSGFNRALSTFSVSHVMVPVRVSTRLSEDATPAELSL